MTSSRDSRLWKKLVWFFVLWAGGVAAVMLLGLVIRTMLPGS